MSRSKKFALSLASGYVLLGMNVLFTLASVPLALHYLSRDLPQDLAKQAFGLWALVSQISGYLLLIDFGMAGSISRILIDHKDHPANGVYGTVIKTGVFVLAAQGAIITVAGMVVSIWLPTLFAVPVTFHHDFQFLFAGQCCVFGVLFVGRMFSHVLQAHQRYDVTNYSQIGGFVVSFAVQWFGFARGWGVYSLLVANAAGTFCSMLFMLAAIMRLNFFPPAGAWGKAQWVTFKEMFLFGADLFLLSIGHQLTNASQVVIVSRTLGLEMAAVWSIATKSFVMAQQLVWNFLTYSAGAISEMIVRDERERFHRRFRELVLLTASAGVFVGGSIAVCNGGFLQLWTNGRISWNACNDWLMALWLLVSCITRCHTGLTGLTKQIRAMRYIYFAEGLCFVGLGLLVTSRFGISAMILTAVILNIIWSGTYGVWRSAEEFKESALRIAFGWLRAPCIFLLVFTPLAMLLGLLIQPLKGAPRLMVGLIFVLVVGLTLLWHVGLTKELREEFTNLAKQLIHRCRRGKATVVHNPDDD